MRAVSIRQYFLVLICIFCLWGCASTMAVNSSTSIGTNANGIAVGQYSDSRSGLVTPPISAWIAGGGGGAGLAGGGLGAMGGGFSRGQVETQGDPMKFARAIALINYTRSLAADNTSGSKDNIFNNRPLRQRDYQPFGHQAE